MKLRTKLLTLLVGIGCIGSTICGINLNNSDTKVVSADTSTEPQIKMFVVDYTSGQDDIYTTLTYYLSEDESSGTTVLNETLVGPEGTVYISNPVPASAHHIKIMTSVIGDSPKYCSYVCDFTTNPFNTFYVYYASSNIYNCLEFTQPSYYAEYFNSFMGYGTGVCDYNGGTNTTLLQTRWNEQIIAYNYEDNYLDKSAIKNATSTSSGELGKFAALYDFIYAKYGSSLGLTNFANRTVSVSSSNGSSSSYLYRGASATDSNNYVILIIVSASTLLLLSAGTVLLIKKKKRIK